MHLKIFAGFFPEYLESGVFPRKFPTTTPGNSSGSPGWSRTAVPTGPPARRRSGRSFSATCCAAASRRSAGVCPHHAGDGFPEHDLDQVTYRTADLGISLVLRMVFFSFLLSGLFVRNIRRLADAARRVGEGDLETRIELGPRMNWVSLPTSST
jgi:hypothetical protein